MNMWTIREIKSRAWEALRSYYWKAFLVSLVIAIAGGGFNFNYRTGSTSTGTGFPGGLDSISPAFIVLVAVAVLAGFLIFFAFHIFIGYPLEIGGRKYFVQAQQNNEDMNYLGFAFNKSRYKDIIIAMIWRGFLNFLWYLLLIIPGIVMFYAYRMVPYILTDNPNIGYKRAVQLSTQMMKGNKFHMFLLDLSFIGWLLLGVLALFIGVLFVMPYINSAKAELYLVLRRNALAMGISNYDELQLEQSV